MNGVSLSCYVSRYRLRFGAAVSGLFLAFMLAVIPPVSAINIGGPSDCDDNAIVKCGVHSTGEVVSKYNGSAYVRAVYAYFGVGAGDINNLGATNVAGYVTKNGNVFVNGQSGAVASNAVTAGRQDIGNSTRVNSQGAVFFVRPPSVSFQQDSLPAFVSMKNGAFQFAIIASCGNTVKATPKTVTPPASAKPTKTPTVRTAPPKPAPAPAQVQSQSQSQSVNVNNTNTQNVTTQPTPAAQTSTSTSQPSAQPTSLVNTGPTGTIGAFLASIGLGTWAYRRFILRRLASQVTDKQINY